MTRALITCHHLQRGFDAVRPLFDGAGITTILPEPVGQQFGAEAMRAHIRGVDAVIAGDDVIDASVIDAGHASGLRAIVKWGIGTDSIDKECAAALGIPVFNTPGVFSDEVADLALGHLILLARRLHEMNAAVLAGTWPRVRGRTLAGLVAGVVGLGSIGQGVARRLRGFGMSVLGSDPRPVPEAVALGVEQVTLDAVLRGADVVVVCCALTAQNRHMIDAAAFAKMKAGSLIINVGRGPLIDEAALVDALASGRIAGAGLDVFEVEPLPMTSPLRRFSDRCIFTTHAGSNTEEAVARINRVTTDILLDVLGIQKAVGFVPNRVA